MQASDVNQRTSPEQRSTEFVAAEQGDSGQELRSFGVIFCILWMLLLAFLFFTRRRQDALWVKVRTMEAALQKKL